MIRLLLRLIVFATGLCLAAIWLGQMHHLRAAVTGELPSWSNGIPDGSGVRSGQAVLKEAGWPQLDVNWQAQAPVANGLLWRFDIAGDGVVFEGDVTVPYWPDRLLVTGRGSLDLAKLARGDAKGIVALRAIDGEITFDRRFQTAFIDAMVSADVPDGLPEEYLSALGAFGYEPGKAWQIKLPVPLSVVK